MKGWLSGYALSIAIGVALPILAVLAVPILLLASLVAAVFAFFKRPQYAINLLLVVDRIGNTAAGGDPVMTISQRLGNASITGAPICSWICRQLGFLGKDHCAFAADPNAPSVGKQLWNWDLSK